MPKLKHPSDRAQKYAYYISQDCTRQEAALRAGYSLSVARNPGRTLHNQPGVTLMLFRALGPKSKIWGLAEGMDATKLEITPKFKKTKSGWKRIRGLYTVEAVPDNAMRLKYLKLTFKALGWIK